MASSLAQNTITFDAAAQEYKGWFCVNIIVFRAPTNTAHTCKITDSNDNEICTINAGATGEDVSRKFGGKFCNGLKVATLGSGSAEIHII